MSAQYASRSLQQLSDGLIGLHQATIPIADHGIGSFPLAAIVGVDAAQGKTVESAATILIIGMIRISDPRQQNYKDEWSRISSNDSSVAAPVFGERTTFP